MRRLLAQIERGLPAPTVRRPSEPVWADDTGIDSETGGTDLDRVYREVEAELRLEAVEERERALAELEERLRRRERNLAAFVGEAQSRLS
jgi:hypothetical protein